MNNFKILIRCDASESIGLGHISRCATIAKELIKRKIKVYFIIRSKNYNYIIDYLKKNGVYSVIDYMPFNTDNSQDAEITSKIYNNNSINFMILDHYRTDTIYQKILLKNKCKWAQFDYKAEYNICSQIVINANIDIRAEDYSSLIKKNNTKLLIGPEYIIIDDKFKNISSDISSKDKNLYISMMFGAGYDRGLFIKATKHLQKLYNHNKKIKFNWITTDLNPSLNELIKITNNNDIIKLYVNSIKFPSIITKSQYVLSSGGHTTNEIVFLKKPVVIFPVVENQMKLAYAWASIGVGYIIKNLDELNQLNLKSLNNFLDEANTIYNKKGIIPGNGASNIVNFIISNYLNTQNER